MRKKPTTIHSSSSFLLAIDLETFAVQGHPRSLMQDGFIIEFTGHLTHNLAGNLPEDALETLKGAYLRHGENLSAHILGQYAAVFVDLSAKRVLLVQDSLGLHPLFYQLDNAGLIVSGDLETLVAFLRPNALNERYFAECLGKGTVPHRQTPFSGIERLAYGTTLIVERSRRLEVRPWVPRTERRLRNSKEAALKLRSLLDEAVHCMLPTEGRVLCELSGGLDSTCVFTTAQKVCPQIEALTLVSGQRMAGDDEYFAKLVLDPLEIPWHRIDIDLYPNFSSLPTDFAGEPGSEMHVAVQAAYREVIMRREIDVILTGGGGDVVFGFGGLPPMHLADGLSKGNVLDGIHAARRWRDHAGGRGPGHTSFCIAA